LLLIGQHRFSPGDHLTQRQREIAALIAQGLTNEEIADRLVVSAGTVANHVASILQRLNVGSRTRIAAWAVEHGLSGSRIAC
jgi:DNA-binding NarL/FixJ family response regulator